MGLGNWVRSNKKRKSRQAKARKRGFPKPGIFLDKVNLRHAADKQDLLPKMEESLRTEGWNGRPLLVPYVLIPRTRFKNANLVQYESLAPLLQKAGFRKAAQLVRLEIKLGSTAKPILPTKRPPAGSRSFGIKLVAQNLQEPANPQGNC